MTDPWVRLSVLAFVVVYSTIASAGAIYKPPQCPATGISVYPNDNCALYYVCDNGMLKVLACPLGQRFDRLLERCRPNFLVSCALQPLPTLSPNSTVAPPTTHPTTSSTKPSNQTTTSHKPGATTAKPTTTPKPTTPKPTTPKTTTPKTTTPKTTTPKPICPATGHTLVPTGDCVSYYNCTNGKYVIETCSPGNLFDPKTLKCGLFYTVSCLPVTAPPPATSTTKPSAPVVCPASGTKIVPTGDCVTYYNCTNSKYIIDSCPPGNLLDPQTLKCGPFYNVSCVPSLLPVGVPTTPKPTQPPAVKCPSSGKQNIPSGNCVTYYECTNGKYTVQTCPSGDLFDPKKDQCVPFYSVTCYPQVATTPIPVKTTVSSTTIKPKTTTKPTTTTAKTTTKAPTTKAPTTTQKSTTKAPTTTSKPGTTTSPPKQACPASGHVSYPTGDCTSYYDCTDGVVKVQTCPLFTSFDPSASVCLPSFLYPCTPATVTEPPPAALAHSDLDKRPSLSLCPPSGQYFYPGDDCQTYQSCSDGTFIVRTCPPGHSYDKVLHECLPSQSVQCSPPVSRNELRDHWLW